MNKLEQAAQQALEALRATQISNYHFTNEQAITALREALEQPDEIDWIETNKALAKEIIELQKQAEQEPVGYWDGKFSKGGASALYEVPQASAFGYHYENYPLYKHPVRTKDLTDDEITNKWESMGRGLGKYTEFARAVIAADRELNK